MGEKLTMTLNLSPREMAVLNELAEEMDVSKTIVMRQALKLYQLAHVNAKRGSHIQFSGDPPMRLEIIAAGFGGNAHDL